MAKKDLSTETDSTQALGRRGLIKKALALGSAGYVAPLVLGSATPASAQAVSIACTTPDCESQCGPNGACACIQSTGGLACVTPFCPDPVTACTSNADCPANMVCMTTDCCGETTNICVFLCGNGPVPDTNARVQRW